MPASTDDNESTADTVNRMCEHIRWSRQFPIVQRAAQDALKRFGSVVMRGQKRRRAHAAWSWVKHCCKFVQDEPLMRSMLGEQNQRDFLIAPWTLLAMKEPQGDCDDFTMLVCSLLQALGMEWEIVTVAVDPEDPARWSHVYCVALVEDGERMPLDASHGKYLGWEVPREHMFRYGAWDENGSPIPGRSPAVRSGLHGYQPTRGLGLRRPVVRARRRGFRGLGQDDGTGIDFSDFWNDISGSSSVPSTVAGDVSSSSSLDLSNYWNQVENQIQQYAGMSPTTSATSSSSNGTSTAAIANLGAQWTSLLGKLIAPTTTIVGPGGLQVSTPSSNAASVLSAFSGSGLTSASLSSLLPLLLLGGGVLLVVMMAGGRR